VKIYLLLFKKNSSFATNKTSDEDKGSGQMQIFDRKKLESAFILIEIIFLLHLKEEKSFFC
jgi:hypothetical protein